VVVSGHHGEILQGVFEDADGRVHRGLVTLRCSLFASRATFVLGPHPVRVRPVTKLKALRAAELTLEHLASEAGGLLTLETNSFEGWGLGSSTSDVTAAILAVSRTLGADIAPADVARIAVRAEGAVDSLMFDGDAVLFAHREGCVLERFARPLPPLAVLGLNPAPDRGGVDTLGFLPAPYPPSDVLIFEDLRRTLRRAIGTQDARLLGQVATASAIINQRYLPVPHFDTLLRVARLTDAAGVQVAHSGRVVGLLFDPARPDCADAMSCAEQLLARWLPGHVRWLFHTETR
jgi:uncharacterized protein involved in propanediol utilization